MFIKKPTPPTGFEPERCELEWGAHAARLENLVPPSCPHRLVRNKNVKRGVWRVPNTTGQRPVLPGSTESFRLSSQPHRQLVNSTANPAVKRFVARHDGLGGKLFARPALRGLAHRRSGASGPESNFQPPAPGRPDRRTAPAARSRCPPPLPEFRPTRRATLGQPKHIASRMLRQKLSVSDVNSPRSAACR